MKLTNKEKILLSILGAVLIGAMYYQFIYVPQTHKLEILKEKKTKIEARYQEVMQSIRLLDKRQEEMNLLENTINFKSRTFYPTILQDKLILDLNTFLNSSTLNGDIGFSEITVNPIEIPSSQVKLKSQSTFQGIVNQYEGDVQKSINETENEEPTNESTSNITNEDSITPTVEMLKVSLNFKGDYDSLKSFISKIETSGREIIITDLTSTVGYNGELTGTMNLEFYAIPKISEDDTSYLQWNMNGRYGKKIPYLIQKPEVVIENPSNQIQDNQEKNINNNSSNNTNMQTSKADFVVMVKSNASDLPSLTIGKSGEKNQNTYIKSDQNKPEDAEISFNKIDNNYYYKYKIGEKYYPTDYDGKGLKFSPNSNQIVVDVDSEARLNNDDKSSLKLSVLNKTDKIVEVVIKGDDKKNPRVSIIGDSSKVKVIRK